MRQDDLDASNQMPSSDEVTLHHPCSVVHNIATCGRAHTALNIPVGQLVVCKFTGPSFSERLKGEAYETNVKVLFAFYPLQKTYSYGTQQETVQSVYLIYNSG